METSNYQLGCCGREAEGAMSRIRGQGGRNAGRGGEERGEGGGEYSPRFTGVQKVLLPRPKILFANVANKKKNSVIHVFSANFGKFWPQKTVKIKLFPLVPSPRDQTFLPPRNLTLEGPETTLPPRGILSDSPMDGWPLVLVWEPGFQNCCKNGYTIFIGIGPNLGRTSSSPPFHIRQVGVCRDLHLSFKSEVIMAKKIFWKRVFWADHGNSSPGGCCFMMIK